MGFQCFVVIVVVVVVVVVFDSFICISLSCRRQVQWGGTVWYPRWSIRAG